MNIDNMTFDDFDIPFDTAPEPEVAKPHHSALEVASWLRQRGVYGTLLKKATKLVTSMKSLVMQSSGACKCDKCADEVNPATGEIKPGHWWHFNKQAWYPCAKCAGKGFVTKIDEARTAAYHARTAPNDFSWSNLPKYAS